MAVVMKKVDLVKDDQKTGLENITFGVSWGGSSIDVDSHLVVLDESESILHHSYYATQSAKYPGVKHHGDDTTGRDAKHSSDNEVIEVDLTKLPKNATGLILFLNVFSSGRDMSDVGGGKMRIYEGTPHNKIRTFVEKTNNKSKDKAVVLGILTKENGVWKFLDIGNASPSISMNDSLEDKLNKFKRFYRDIIRNTDIKDLADEIKPDLEKIVDGAEGLVDKVTGFVKRLFS